MGTVIIVGAIWILLLVFFLWFNYRFHRYYSANNGPGFVLENSVTIESNDEWSRELKLSRG